MLDHDAAVQRIEIFFVFTLFLFTFFFSSFCREDQLQRRERSPYSSRSCSPFSSSGPPLVLSSSISNVSGRRGWALLSPFSSSSLLFSSSSLFTCNQTSFSSYFVVVELIFFRRSSSVASSIPVVLRLFPAKIISNPLVLHISLFSGENLADFSSSESLVSPVNYSGLLLVELAVSLLRCSSWVVENTYPSAEHPTPIFRRPFHLFPWLLLFRLFWLFPSRFFLRSFLVSWCFCYESSSLSSLFSLRFSAHFPLVRPRFSPSHSPVTRERAREREREWWWRRIQNLIKIN